VRLKAKLYSILAAVIAGSAIVSLVAIWISAERQVRRFIYSGDIAQATAVAEILSDWHRERNSWSGVEVELERLNSGHWPMMRGHMGPMWEPRILLAGPDGRVLADTAGRSVGETHPLAHVQRGAVVSESGRPVGYVLVDTMVDPALNPVDLRFLRSVIVSVVASNLLAAGLAFAAGGLFLSRIVARVGTLAGAAASIAAGDFGIRVPPRGADEIAALGESFNTMAAALKRLEEARRQIIADAAHELRTPITLIRGAVEAMLDGVYPLDREGLEGIQEETIQLTRLVEDLQELALIESGSLVLERTPLQVEELARSVADSFQPQARQADLELTLQEDSGIPPIQADAKRIRQVLSNLLSNAVRHTPAGGRILVSVRFDPLEGRLVVIVEDSGTGIPPDERERVFERFYRIDRSRERSRGGRGLGLSIVREIVRAHGGIISAGESHLGGASFNIYLPRGSVTKTE
jgi:signal transduction histidine kinase